MIYIVHTCEQKRCVKTKSVFLPGKNVSRFCNVSVSVDFNETITWSIDWDNKHHVRVGLVKFCIPSFVIMSLVASTPPNYFSRHEGALHNQRPHSWYSCGTCACPKRSSIWMLNTEFPEARVSEMGRKIDGKLGFAGLGYWLLWEVYCCLVFLWVKWWCSIQTLYFRD